MNNPVPINPEIPDFEVGLEIFHQAVRESGWGDIFSLGITLIQTAWQQKDLKAMGEVSQQLFQILQKENPNLTRISFLFFDKKTCTGLFFANGIATIIDADQCAIITRGSRN